MKQIGYKKWKQYCMDATDPKNGSKLGIIFQDCNKKTIRKIKWIEKLEGCEFYLPYTLFMSNKRRVIELDSLDEFEDAQLQSAYDGFWEHPLSTHIIPINCGFATLYTLIDYKIIKDDVKERLAEMSREGGKIPENYDGLPIPWEMYDA